MVERNSQSRPPDDLAGRLVTALEEQTEAMSEQAHATDNLAEAIDDFRKFGEKTVTDLLKKLKLGKAIGSLFGANRD